MPVKIPVLARKGQIITITHDCPFPGYTCAKLLYLARLIKDLEFKDINGCLINLVDLANIISFVYIAWIPKNDPIWIILDRANDGILESEDKIFFNKCVDRIIRDIMLYLKRTVAVA